MQSLPLQISAPFSSAVRSPSPVLSPVKFRRCTVAAAATATAEKTSSYYCSPRPSPSSTASLYEVLDLPVGATAPEIKAAYRRLARILHPDVAGGDGKELSAGEFMKIHAAYATLSDSRKRADYDRELFRRLRRFDSLSGISSSAAAMSGFSGYTRRKWETDQCW